jgi:hypothetical protein
MSSNKYMIAAEINDHIRGNLLRIYRPTLGFVYCRQILWVYDCAEDEAVYPGREAGQDQAEMLTCDVVGLHQNNLRLHEALVVKIGHRTHRPDGVLLHIALSTQPGVPPVAAGEIDPALVLNPDRVEISFPVTFRVMKARKIMPQPREQLAA